MNKEFLEKRFSKSTIKPEIVELKYQTHLLYFFLGIKFSNRVIMKFFKEDMANHFSIGEGHIDDSRRISGLTSTGFLKIIGCRKNGIYYEPLDQLEEVLSYYPVEMGIFPAYIKKVPTNIILLLYLDASEKYWKFKVKVMIATLTFDKTIEIEEMFEDEVVVNMVYEILNKKQDVLDILLDRIADVAVGDLKEVLN